MHNLIIDSGFLKKAAPEDGPSLEQQFGILTNGRISAKYPKLDDMRLAFQLIEQRDKPSGDAVGVAVYVVGSSVVMVPSFYHAGDINTGDMMFLPDEQIFLPLSEPWLAWVQQRGLGNNGTIIPRGAVGREYEAGAETIRKRTDPLLKTACLYLRGLLRVNPDLERDGADVSVLDMALGMGKEASCALLTAMDEDDGRLVNAFLQWNGKDAVLDFVKTAAERFGHTDTEAETSSLLEPFTDLPGELTPDERIAMHRDGFVIRTAGKDAPPVIRCDRLKTQFTTVTASGIRVLPSFDGSARRCLVMRSEPLCFKDPADVHDRGFRRPLPGTSNSVIVFTGSDGNKCIDMRTPIIEMASSETMAFNRSMLEGRGTAASKCRSKLTFGSLVLCPDGIAYRLSMEATKHNDCWISGGQTILVGDDPEQISPVKLASCIVLPSRSRIVAEPDYERDSSTESRFVGPDALEHFMRSYTSKYYHRIKLTSNGTETSVTGDKSSDSPMSTKQASLHLVNDYNIDPADVRLMMDDVLQGSPRELRHASYLVYKTAALEDVPANAGYTEVENKGPVTDDIAGEAKKDIEQIKETAIEAANSGVKEVFDVTVLKQLVKRTRVNSDISDDMPLFMRVLDSICKKLFMLYWHTENFSDKYGASKLKEIENGLKNALDTLSEITIFFVIRSSEGISGTGIDGGELMRGHDL